jgi:pilus assembly protein Flp/PilA
VLISFVSLPFVFGDASMKTILNFFGSEEGASGAEYALLLAIVGAGIAAAAAGLGGAIAGGMTSATNAITGANI